MATTSDDLVRELKHLRRGWGVRADLGTRLGPHLAALCGAATGDEPERRRKLCGHLRGAAARLPDEMALAALAGLCLHPEAELRQLEDRLEWLAEKLSCSVRTATRRLDESLEMLAEELLRDVSSPASGLDPAEGWYVSHSRLFYDSMVRLLRLLSSERLLQPWTVCRVSLHRSACRDTRTIRATATNSTWSYCMAVG